MNNCSDDFARKTESPRSRGWGGGPRALFRRLPYFPFWGALILHFLHSFTKEIHEKYELTSVLLLNNLAGAFAREQKYDFLLLAVESCTFDRQE